MRSAKFLGMTVGFHGSTRGCGTSVKKRLQDHRGASLEEEGDLIREQQVVHENFLSRWLREDEEGNVEEKGSFRTGAKQGVTQEREKTG